MAFQRLKMQENWRDFQSHFKDKNGLKNKSVLNLSILLLWGSVALHFVHRSVILIVLVEGS